jgi:hypothetical protein
MVGKSREKPARSFSEASILAAIAAGLLIIGFA